MHIAIIIICALLLLFAGALFYSYHRVFYAPTKDMTETGAPLPISNGDHRDDVAAMTRKMVARECEFVYTRSYDRLRLRGRYYHIRDGAPVCICFHGYKGAGVRDFSVMGDLLMNDGYNVLLIAHRAHLGSSGHTITYGIRERRDVLSWVSYVIERFGGDCPIYLFGISMGAATVLMSSDLDLPDNVRAICADCPFSSPKDIICFVTDAMGMPSKLMWPYIRLSALVYGHLNIRRDITAANAAHRSKKPMLIVHGEADKFVPMQMSEEIYLANPDCVERHTFPGAGHGLSYYADPDRYKAVVRDFMKRHP